MPGLNLTGSLSGLTIQDGAHQSGSASLKEGGGVLCENFSLLKITDCVFVNNKVSGDLGLFPGGNGGVARGGAISLSGGSLAELIRCSLNGHRAFGGGGGNNSGTLTFGGQGATGSGGAIYVSSSGVLTMTNCTFLDNAAFGAGAGGHGGGAGPNGEGGAIGSAGPIVLLFCTVAGNFSFGGSGEAANNSPSGIGRAVRYISNSQSSVNNSIVAGNLHAGNLASDVRGTFDSRGYNLIGATDGSTGFGAGGDSCPVFLLSSGLFVVLSFNHYSFTINHSCPNFRILPLPIPPLISSVCLRIKTVLPRKMKPMRSLLVLCLAVPSLATADVIPEGAGIVYGKDHVFSLKAPKNWALDNSSAAKNGIPAVFFPTGSTWAKSKVVAYARTRPIDEKVKTAKDAVDAVLAEFHAKGSPNYKATKDKDIKTESGTTGIVYKFTGDKFGNFEAACYFKDKKTINFVVLSSRDQEAFNGAWEAFIALCKSYAYITDHYTESAPKKAEQGGSDQPATIPKSDPSI